MYKILISVILALLISQLVKFVILKANGSPLTNEVLFHEYGGMPSTHTAVVFAGVFSIYFLEGFSNLFYITLLFALVIAVDVHDVRWFYTIRDKKLNQVIKSIDKNFHKRIAPLRGVFGHTSLEIIVGILIAFSCSYFAFKII